MKINNTKNEDISAFMDGEISAVHDDTLMQELRQSEHRQSWDVYHQIGDALRSDEMAINCSAEFSSKLAARLAAEPIYFPAAPQSATMDITVRHGNGSSLAGTRSWYVRPSRVASGLVATAAVIYFGSTFLFDPPGGKNNSAAGLASLSTATNAAAPTQMVAADVDARSAVVMRDPRIDAYLIAHQRFSPSLYSTAQFARSANFATDSAK